MPQTGAATAAAIPTLLCEHWHSASYREQGVLTYLRNQSESFQPVLDSKALVLAGQSYVHEPNRGGSGMGSNASSALCLHLH